MNKTMNELVLRSFLIASLTIFLIPASGLIVNYAPPPKPVLDRPYSGEEINELTEIRPDGKQVRRTVNHWKMYRDSQGRTRTERFLSADTTSLPEVIEITDPSAQIRYMLDTHREVAIRSPLPYRSSEVAIFSAPTPPPPFPESAAATAKHVPHPPPTHKKTEKLPVQSMEGLTVAGERTTITYPVGAAHNDHEFAVVSEAWTSPELKLVIFSKASDPRSGERTLKLVNISRQEPDASLFQPPRGYRITEEKGHPPRKALPRGVFF